MSFLLLLLLSLFLFFCESSVPKDPRDPGSLPEHKLSGAFSIGTVSGEHGGETVRRTTDTEDSSVTQTTSRGTEGTDSGA